MDQIRNIIREVFDEAVKNKRNLLFIDEDGKNIVYNDELFKIAVNNVKSATYITLWHKEIVNDKEYWAKRGALSAHITERKDFLGKYGTDFKNFLSVDSIEIEKEYRNRGYGLKMYQALIDFSKDGVIGIYSYLPNRVNKAQVPSIYKRLNAKIIDDYQVIYF